MIFFYFIFLQRFYLNKETSNSIHFKVKSGSDNLEKRKKSCDKIRSVINSRTFLGFRVDKKKYKQNKGMKNL